MDLYRLVAALVSLIAGGSILTRMITTEFSPLALLAGLAFLGFAIYRFNMAARRYVQYRLGERQARAQSEEANPAK